MARITTTSVRCKNKLCDYKGTVRHYDHIEPSLVCPVCGFKTLEQYWPQYEGMFKALKDVEQ